MSIVVLGRDGPATSILANDLLREFEVARVVLEQREPRRAFIQRRVRRLGIRRVAGELLFRGLVMPVLARTSAPRLAEINREYGLDDSPIDPRLVVRVRSANDPVTLRALQRVGSAVVVLSGPRILSSQILGEVSATFLNLHAGITPLYRGVHGAYWALVSGDRRHCGVTVHVVDEGVDTGDILAQARIAPTDRDTFVTYPRLQLATGLPLLRQAIIDAFAGRRVIKPPPPGESRLWTHPTLSEYLRNWRALGVR